MDTSIKYRQPWLQSASFDGLYILLPGLLALIITFLLPEQYKSTDEIPLAGWIILILFIDVAHVYSTLFRTYWDHERFSQHRTLYITIPFVCYIVGVLLYAINGMLFWRILAYLAVFHFIRQQYGFMRLYSRFERKRTFRSRLDMLTIYAATIYPLIYWHCTPGRNFSWFVTGDFLISEAILFRTICGYIYLVIVLTYLVTEIIALLQTGKFNLPKNLVITGTIATWYFGIVYFNGDMAFTLLNVVAHGIPYMALIWLFNKKERKPDNNTTEQSFINKYKYNIIFFLLSIFVFAYIEEGLWDGMIWREHKGIFGFFSGLPSINSKEVLALLVPLLSLPQSTHYVLDGFIWRKKQDVHGTQIAV
ncbi:MAG: hypothetical protein KDC07_02125 [Chitinophagaceae bacterium]|nr:hypothetical protein [Chitinophagaceae bacterium]